MTEITEKGGSSKIGNTAMLPHQSMNSVCSSNSFTSKKMECNLNKQEIIMEQIHKRQKKDDLFLAVALIW